MAIAVLNVHSNPYAVLDHDGQPHCAIDKIGTSTPIGARFDHARHEQTKRDSVSSFKEGKHVFVFTDRVSTLVCRTLDEFDFYTRQVREGALLPADAKTAAKCRVEKFIPYADALRAAEAAAAERWKRAYGEAPDFSAFKIERAASKATAPAPATPEADPVAIEHEASASVKE